MEKQNLSSLIWSTADDILRGLFKPSEYGRIILPFVVLRRLDCVLEPQKDKAFELHEKYNKKLKDFNQVIQSQLNLPFFNVSKFDLLRIKSDPNNVYKNFNNYIQGFSKNVLDIIQNFQIDPLVTKLNKNKKLYLLIDKFTEFDLHPGKVDNHMMGSIYEELLRKFSEMSNEESGDHFTPRDIVKLLVSLVFEGDKENLKGEGKIRSVYDPCCGTGGMLTIGKKWIHENINEKLKVELYGQELNDVTYAICKSDFLMSNENPENIKGPYSSLSEDKYQDRKFDYMITNPPFGVSWKSEKDFIKNESKDSNGRFILGLPKTSDGSLLFLQHLIHKMDPKHARIGIIFNSSPLFSGDAGSGESNIRKWIIENDYLECVVQLPDNMFFNTGITTYLWILTNNKDPIRKNKIQLINGENFFQQMRRNLGSKNRLIKDEQIKKLLDTYIKNEENDYSKIYENKHFCYTKLVVEQPLIEDGKIKKNAKGKIKPDKSKNDFEYVPISTDIENYFENEIKPFVPESWLNRNKDKIGYSIKFREYFYKARKVRDSKVLSNEINFINKKIDELFLKIKNIDLIEKKLQSNHSNSNECKSFRLKYFATVSGRIGWKALTADEYVDKGYIFLSTPNIKTEKIDFDNVNYITKERYEESPELMLKKDDVLLVKTGSTLGIVNYIESLPGKSTINSSITLIRIYKKIILPKFLYYYLKNSSIQNLMQKIKTGMGVPSITQHDIKNFKILIPNLTEQKKIIELLDEKIPIINQLKSLNNDKLELIKEFNYSLLNYTNKNKEFSS